MSTPSVQIPCMHVTSYPDPARVLESLGVGCSGGWEGFRWGWGCYGSVADGVGCTQRFGLWEFEVNCWYAWWWWGVISLWFCVFVFISRSRDVRRRGSRRRLINNWGQFWSVSNGGSFFYYDIHCEQVDQLLGTWKSFWKKRFCFFDSLQEHLRDCIPSLKYCTYWTYSSGRVKWFVVVCAYVCVCVRVDKGH